jgi:asparagine synthase (glutamine-hydrolysing)
MCGIAGIVSMRGIEPSLSRLKRSMDLLRHRGRDDEGYLLVNRRARTVQRLIGIDSHQSLRAGRPSLDNSSALPGADLALAHRRFAIICPTVEGHQPFRSQDGQVWIVFNGEIYNYLEVREELRGLGHEFVTGTDTEVLVEAYKRWGSDCFSRLNGMWALALFDVARSELILCRDRTGERPLYWTERDGEIAFASEIPALLALGGSGAPSAHDPAVLHLLWNGVADVDESTSFASVRSLPPARVVTVDMSLGVHVADRYWTVPRERLSSSQISVGDATARLRELLRDSVHLQLRADVPLTVALSGGLDSSTIAVTAAQVFEAPLDSYTVRFHDKDWDEGAFAATVASRLGKDSLVMEPSPLWVWDHLEAFVLAMAEPVHAPDLLIDYVARHVLAGRGFRVALSGIGGDELFAGYSHHRDNWILDLKDQGHRWRALGNVLLASDTTAGRVVANAIARRWRRQSRREPYSAILTLPAPERAPSSHDLSNRLWDELNRGLLPYWLRVGDRSGMAVPIEVRYPLLDHRLIEFAFRLPIDYLLRWGWQKWILRKAMERSLPGDIAWRRKKMGFPFPIKRWLRENAGVLRTIFSKMDNPYVRREPWIARLDELSQSDPWLVWRALSVELWHRHFIRGLPILPEETAKHVPRM